MVMTSGSMTIAGEMLKISQPAVSRLIKDLERSLSIRLFRREGNRLIPGAEAQRLFREVDRFYQGIEQVERVADDLKSMRTGTLRVACISSLGLEFMSEAVKRFLLARPGVITSLEVSRTIGILELTAANQVDVGLVGFLANEYPGVDVQSQLSLPSVCVLPQEHPLAKKPMIELADLAGQPLISLGRNSPLRMRLDRALDAGGVVCQRPIETSFAHSACQMVASGLGLTVADPFTVAHIRDSRVVIRPLSPILPFILSTVLPAHQPRSIVVSDFLKVIRELLREQFQNQLHLPDGVQI